MFGKTPYHFVFYFYCVSANGDLAVLPIEANTLPQAMQVFRVIQEKVQAEGDNLNFYHIEQGAYPRASAN